MPQPEEPLPLTASSTCELPTRLPVGSNTSMRASPRGRVAVMTPDGQKLL